MLHLRLLSYAGFFEYNSSTSNNFIKVLVLFKSRISPDICNAVLWQKIMFLHKLQYHIERPHRNFTVFK